MAAGVAASTKQQIFALLLDMRDAAFPEPYLGDFEILRAPAQDHGAIIYSFWKRLPTHPNLR